MISDFNSMQQRNSKTPGNEISHSVLLYTYIKINGIKKKKKKNRYMRNSGRSIF